MPLSPKLLFLFSLGGLALLGSTCEDAHTTFKFDAAASDTTNDAHDAANAAGGASGGGGAAGSAVSAGNAGGTNGT